MAVLIFGSTPACVFKMTVNFSEDVSITVRHLIVKYLLFMNMRILLLQIFGLSWALSIQNTWRTQNKGSIEVVYEIGYFYIHGDKDIYQLTCTK